MAMYCEEAVRLELCCCCSIVLWYSACLRSINIAVVLTAFALPYDRMLQFLVLILLKRSTKNNAFNQMIRALLTHPLFLMLSKEPRKEKANAPTLFIECRPVVFALSNVNTKRLVVSSANTTSISVVRAFHVILSL